MEVVNHSIRLSLSSAPHQKGFLQSRRAVTSHSVGWSPPQIQWPQWALEEIPAWRGLCLSRGRRPGSLDRRSKAGKQLIPDWLVSAWCSLCQRQMQTQLIDCWPQYSAWNERPGLGGIFRRNVSLGRPWQPRSQESASPSFRKDLLEEIEGELVIFSHRIVTCQEDKTSKIGTAQGTELWSV